MSEDEKVNGPKLAADILSRMESSARERIVKRIEAQDPQLAAKIHQNIFTFENIPEINEKGVQTLLKEINHDDLVLSLKKAPEQVRSTFYKNMSERKRTLVKEDLAALDPVPVPQVEEAQRRILAKVDELRTRGEILTESDHDIWV